MYFVDALCGERGYDRELKKVKRLES